MVFTTKLLEGRPLTLTNIAASTMYKPCSKEDTLVATEVYMYISSLKNSYFYILFDSTIEVGTSWQM